MAAPGTDIAFSESRTEGYRAFANKIWKRRPLQFMECGAALVLCGTKAVVDKAVWDRGSPTRS